MPLVHTTLFENPIEVPEDEVEVLRNQGLLRGEPGRPAPEGERRYPVTEVPDQGAKPDVTGGEPGITVAAADKPAGPGAGEKPDTKENA